MNACYAFSGDPITYGHIDIIKRSLQVFNHITVAIGSNPSKRYLFSLDERTRMTEETLKCFGDSISVKSFDGLLVDFLKENCITHIIRGIRSTSDFEYEKELSSINQTQNNGIDTWFLTSNKNMDVVSSSASKEIVKHIGNSEIYVPIYIKNKLEQKLLDVIIIGVTGEIGAGKSYVSKVIDTNYQVHNYNIVNIDVDTIGRNVLEEYKEPIYKSIREQIICNFKGHDIILDGYENNSCVFLDKSKIANIIFDNKEKLDLYNKITKDAIIFKIKSEIRRLIYENQNIRDHRQLIIFLNSALLIEANLLSMVNNNVIFVVAKDDIRIKRLTDRGYSNEEIANRMSSQLNIDNKINLYKEKTNNDNYGNELIIHNNDQNGSNNNILKEFGAFLKTLK